MSADIYPKKNSGVCSRMSSTILESALRDILSAIQPSTEDREARRRIIDEFRAVVQSNGHFRGALVEPFGSFVSDLFTKWGDLDISVELQSRICASSDRNEKKRALCHILLALNGKCRKLDYISRARVPILKFESYHQSISCDISIDNFKGFLKSKIFAWINGIDGRFRQFVLLVKEWAKAHGINNSRDGTFNSYALSLLVIFHFQTCVPPILPPLKELYPRNISDDLSGLRDVVKRRIEETFSSNIARFKLEKRSFINSSSLAELFVLFLEKFRDIDLKASGKVICPYTGKWEYTHSNFKWFSACQVYVEDPFEQPENAARSVRFTGVINEAFRSSHTQLSSANLTRNVAIATVGGSQVSNMLIPEFSNGDAYSSKNNNPSLHEDPTAVNLYRNLGVTLPRLRRFQDQNWRI